MTFGLTPAGFVQPTVQDKVTAINASLLANIDGGLDLDPDQPFGQVVGVFANDIVSVWEIVGTLYNALNPNAAEGNNLVNLCALSGTRPQVATYSTVTATLSLNASTTVNAGAIVSVNNQPTNTWVLLTTVTSTTAGGYSGNFRSSLPGPFVALAGTLTVINTPTVGWTGVTNAADAVQGLPADTDTTLRQKRILELAGQGSGDVDAIRAVLLELPGMINAFVYENTSLATDATGLPGKAIRAVIWDGVGMAVSNTLIAQTIWNQKPSGIQTFGASIGTATDSQGNPQTIYFDRAVQKRTYVTLTTTPAVGVVVDATYRAAIRASVVAYATATFNLGVNIIALTFRDSAVVATLDIDVPTFAFDFTPTPVNTANLPVSGLQIATVASTDISVDGSFS
jgi:baseplate J-like protein